MKIGQFITCLLILSVGIAIGCFTRPKCAEIVDIRVDTLIKIDTVRDTILVPVNRYIARIERDTLRVAGDTVFIAVEIPIERKVYQTDDYRAEIEGYKPSLVSMEVYKRTEYINTVQMVGPMIRPWRVGISAGYRATFINGTTNMSPFANINVNYNKFGLSAGYVATFRDGNTTMIPFVGMNVHYPLFSFGKAK